MNGYYGWNNYSGPTVYPSVNQPSMQTAINLPRSEVVRVHGLDGAKAYQMAPNSSVLLLDETNPIVWLKMTDGAGYPSISGYTLTPIEASESSDKPITHDDLDALEKRIAKLEIEWEGK